MMSRQRPQRLVEELTSARRTFAFTLYRKHNEHWADGIDEQWWMSIPGIYRNGPERNPNSDNIVDHYWSCISDHVRDPSYEDAVERYLQANLLPVYRSNRAARVFLDSIPGKRGLRDSINGLNGLLAQCRGETLCEEEFSQHTVRLLRSDEIPAYCRPPSDIMQQLYHRFHSELLDDPKSVLLRGDVGSAIEIARDNWAAFRRKYVRPAGFSMEKTVLDMLSYENKAAFHHCYSNLWENLIPQLEEKYRWNEATVIFHKFWHLAPHLRDGGGEYTPFHGHIFGLHPGCGWMINTDSGQQLIGNWLNDFRNSTLYQRVLYGLWVSINHYVSRLSEQKMDRR